MDLVLKAGGTFVLRDPAGKKETFYFGRAIAAMTAKVMPAAGTEIPVRLPIMRLPDRIGKDSEDQTAKRSSEGTVFMTYAFHGPELSRSDLEGAAVFVPTAIGSDRFVGPPRAAMLLGIDATDLRVGLSSPATFGVAERALARARAVLVMDDVHLRPSNRAFGFVVGYMS
jgi:hypothetical protein